MLRHLVLVAAATAFCLTPASAQLPDNSTLNGAFNVRYLGVNIDNSANNDVAVGFSGALTFDGKGNFTVNGTGTTAGAALRYRTTGTYTVLSSGMFYMDNPFDPTTTNNTVLYGGVGANRFVIASSTDSLYSDLFVAIPVAATASPSTLNGTYRVAHMEFLAGDVGAGTRNSFFTLTSNGAGAIGDLAVRGTAQSLQHAATTQTISGGTYTVNADGSGTMALPAPSGVTPANTLLSGNKVLYVSADGGFFIAGASNGYDMMIGVRPGATGLDGLYWNAQLSNYQGSSDPTLNGIDARQGSANQIASSNNLEIAHQRVNIDGFFSYDSTYSDIFKFDSSGLATYSSSVYAAGANGTIAIGSGLSSNYLVAIYVKAPAMNTPAGTSVFLNPQGVVNAASFAPITTQIGAGQIVTLFGTNIGPSAATSAPSLPFPTTLGGVSVVMRWSGNTAGTPIPVFFASANQVSAIVPFTGPPNYDLVSFQVQYNGQNSNQVSVWKGPSSPGVFMVPTANSPTAGAIQRFPDYSLITAANPAKAGDTVIVYMTGLGAVTGNVTAGAAPTTTSTVTRRVDVYIDGNLQAPVDFKGVSAFGGFYQLNIRIPSGLTAGEHILEVTTYLEDGQTPDSDSWQATIFIG